MEVSEEKYFVSIGMGCMGGGFVKALGTALIHADMNNTKRIKKAFPEYWEKYLKIGRDLENGS